MASPFPGMDPYLEGYLWPDVHGALAGRIRKQLTPQLRPRYTARLEIYTVEDDAPEGEIGIMYPDVEVVLTQHRSPIAPLSTQQTQPAKIKNGMPLVAPLTLPILPVIEVKIVNVEIRDAGNNQLITCIALLSPVNKREPGLKPYQEKRRRLLAAGVHLLEIDLLRRGVRAFQHPRLPESPYLITLTRAPAKATETWPLTLRDRLPFLPVPSRPPDADVSFDLQAAFDEMYEEAAYDLSINYQESPPPPALSAEDTAWMRKLLGQR
ncbi:MAG: DUF4058 family protein [Caldilineaceae bacterium]